MAILQQAISLYLDWETQAEKKTDIVLVQGDYGGSYRLIVTVFEGDLVKNCTGYRAQIVFARLPEPDAPVVFEVAQCSVTAQNIAVNIPDSVMGASGPVVAEISLFEGSTRKKTLQRFSFAVRGSLDPGSITDEETLRYLFDQLENEVINLIGDAQALVATANETNQRAVTLVNQAEALYTDAIQSAPITGVKTVTSTPAEVFAGATAKAGRTKMMIRNESDMLRIRIGGSNVTQKNGFPMEPGATVELSFHPDIAVAIYAVSEGTATKIGVMEF